MWCTGTIAVTAVLVVLCTMVRETKAFGPEPGKQVPVNSTTSALYKTAVNRVMSGVVYRQL